MATGVRDPACTAESGPVLAPPTFAACFTVARGPSLLDDPELGAHPRLIHSSQEYVFHRPVRVGDVLECRPSITAVTPRGRMDLLALETVCVDADDGEPVVTSRATLVFLNDGG